MTRYVIHHGPPIDSLFLVLMLLACIVAAALILWFTQRDYDFISVEANVFTLLQLQFSERMDDAEGSKSQQETVRGPNPFSSRPKYIVHLPKYIYPIFKNCRLLFLINLAHLRHQKSIKIEASVM